MNITLVRHGEVMFDFKHKLYGRKNVKLSKKGVFDCLNLKDEIKDKHYDLCIVSPLARCVETAMLLIGDRVLTEVDERLLERDMGELTGKERDKYDPSKYWDYNLNSSDEGVECIQDLFKRCEDFLDDIKNKYHDKDVIIVTHESIIRALYIIINKMDLNSNLREFDIPTCYIEEFKLR
ncbi:MAG: histidine phosphatase family protein [Bacilli bacterium]|nr:histidine phosphatase family protein [Bacilli bacterium]